MAHQYDMIGLTDNDENPYIQGVTKILRFYNKEQDKAGKKLINVNQAIKSKTLLAIDIEIYANSQR